MGGGDGDVLGAVGPGARRFVVWLARGSLQVGWFFRSGEVLVQCFTFYLF